MSDYHILRQDEKKKTIEVIFHIPITATGSNSAGLSWPDAIVMDLGGSANIVSELPGISAGEGTQLKAGSLYEIKQTVRFSIVNLTNAQRKAEISAAFIDLTTRLIDEKKITLEWIGLGVDIV